MKSIIVPTDFSSASYNTARYAIALAADLSADKIVLYNAYQPYIPEDPEYNTILTQDISEYKTISEEGLIKMKSTLQAEAPSSLQLDCESDYSMIQAGIESACKKHNAVLVIMGVTGTGNSIEEAIFGSNAVDVARHSKTPVIIVPSAAKYSGLQKILLVLDFKKVAETTPVNEINSLLNATNAQLDVLHVEINDGGTEESVDNEKKILNSLFNNYEPQYYFVKGENFTETINQFAVENNSDLIIVIPKKHGLFESIFKRSHTKALAFHSHIPIMTIHE